MLSKVRCRQKSVVCSKYIWWVYELVPPQESFAIFTLI